MISRDKARLHAMKGKRRPMSNPTEALGRDRRTFAAPVNEGCMRALIHEASVQARRLAGMLIGLIVPASWEPVRHFHPPCQPTETGKAT